MLRFVALVLSQISTAALTQTIAARFTSADNTAQIASDNAKVAVKPISLLSHADRHWRSAIVLPAVLLAVLAIAVLWQSYHLP